MSEKADGGASGRCELCKGELRGSAVLAQHRLWHPDHFTCFVCQKPLKETFQEDEGKAFCAYCYLEKFHPKCCKCQGGIEEAVLWAMKQNWHQRCFTCTGCEKPFGDGNFYVISGKPYDLDCHWAKKLQLHSQPDTVKP